MVIERAKQVLKIEANAVFDLINKVNENFVRAVEILSECQGKVIITGIGKSGIISQKIASTLASTGTPAFFLHPAEGIHGDLGMIGKRDVVVAVSNSGETNEIAQLLPLIKRIGIKLIVMTGNLNSLLAQSSDVVIDIGVKEEACPLGLVPTASSTAAMAMGDALALALLEKRGFEPEDFALLHPGGSLGKKLILKVDDLMHRGKEVPLVQHDTLMKEALLVMTSKRLGVTGVVNEKEELIGIITDGDLRRALEKYDDLLNKKAQEIMTRNPRVISKDELAAKAVQMMEKFSITSLFILEERGSRKPLGILHMHDLLKAGIV
jgi:arabinose-5-phosphate isomerase